MALPSLSPLHPVLHEHLWIPPPARGPLCPPPSLFPTSVTVLNSLKSPKLHSLHITRFRGLYQMSHGCAVWREMKHLILVNLLILSMFMFIHTLLRLEGVRELFQERSQDPSSSAEWLGSLPRPLVHEISSSIFTTNSLSLELLGWLPAPSHQKILQWNIIFIFEECI